MPTTHPADRLLEAIERAGSPACVGLDPVVERIPKAVAAVAGSPVDAIERFSRELIEAVTGVVPCVKPQSACFERFGSAGVAALERVVAHADCNGLEVILDAKRGDIGVSAEHYAEAAFAGASDWVTINAYLGDDGIRPFLRADRGAFALVRTSNPGGDQLQTARLADGRAVADLVAGMIARLGENALGAHGYSALGAVVGATKAEDALRLRALMPRQIFLVPGFGAQGAGVAEAMSCFNADGRGAIVNASRAVIYAFDAADPRWMESVRAAAVAFHAALRGGVETLRRAGSVATGAEAGAEGVGR